MKQYCRYCGFCFDGDALYCSLHKEILSVSKVKHENHCKDFADINEDVWTGNSRKERKVKTTVDKETLQDLFRGE